VVLQRVLSNGIPIELVVNITSNATIAVQGGTLKLAQFFNLSK
jgi:hypothetical protein